MLVEDHTAFREALAFLLGREPDLEVVAQAGSLAEAREALDGGLDVAVLDKVESPSTIVREVRRLGGG